jgi:hypothetical protein
VFPLFSQLVVDLPVLVPVERQVALVLVPVVVLQDLVVQVQMMVQKDSSPYQSVEDPAVQFSDAYYKTSVFLFLSLQQTHHSYHTIHRAHHPADLILLPAELQCFQTEIGRNFSLLVQTFNYFFFVCDNVTEDTIPHFLIFIHHLI